MAYREMRNCIGFKIFPVVPVIASAQAALQIKLVLQTVFKELKAEIANADCYTCLGGRVGTADLYHFVDNFQTPKPRPSCIPFKKHPTYPQF